MRLAGKRLWVMAKGFAPDEGGHQTYAEQVALAYARLGAAVTVVTQTSAGPRRADHRGLDLLDIGPGKGISVPFRWRRALMGLMAEAGRPDFCHGTTWRTSLPPLMCGLPVATTFHGREFIYASGLSRMLLNQVLRRANPLLVVSHHSAAQLRHRLAEIGLEAKAPIVAWNGCAMAPLPRPEQRRPGPLRIMTLCRLEPRKNVAMAIRAVGLLAQRGHRVDYVICGRGPDRERLAAAVRDLPEGANIRLAGYVSHEEARLLHRESDVFLHPQIAMDGGRDFEGFGIAIADAMRAGCIPVAGREGGSAELVEEGVSGFVVDGRQVESIAAALEALADDPERVARMSEAAIARSRLFEWDGHVATLLDHAGL
jgi:phosphatidylinositol alpha-1,6-mannosyltransferase